MCGSCSKTEKSAAEIDTAREISIEEVEGKRYSPLRFHAETFRHMDELREQFEDLLNELRQLRLGGEGSAWDWDTQTQVANRPWPL